MNLTDNEKRDAIKIIESGKPLPDKYRFLLFDDKREVELVWNGKSNEVCNVVLPFQVIEQVDEPRAEKSKKSKGNGSAITSLKTNGKASTPKKTGLWNSPARHANATQDAAKSR